MKMVMIICPASREEEITALIAEHDIHAYSVIRDVVGAGKTGIKMGTHIWPGKSILIFAAVESMKSEELSAALKRCEQDLLPGEGFRAFIMPVESMI